MPFTFYIDDQLTNQPDNGWKVSTLIRRDRELQAQIITQEVNIEYSGKSPVAANQINAYDYLKNLFDTGVCQEARFTIYDQISLTESRLIHKGIIKIPDMDVLEEAAKLTASVSDNAVYSYILNNKDIKVDFRAGKSKNGEDITPLQTYEIDLFDSYSGVYGSLSGHMYQAYKIDEILEFIITVITDGQVGFRSDYFASMDPEIFLIKGQAILNAFSLFPNAQGVYEVSFSEWFRELNVCKNLSFYIDNSDPDNPIFRLENTEATYDTTVTHTFENPMEIKSSVNVKNLYGTVETGSEITADGQDAVLYPWNEATSYFGWRKETFYPLGQCNTDTALRLVSQWIISNNVIQEVLHGSDAYVDNYFLIECEPSDPVTFTAFAKRYSYFGEPTPPYFYNFGLNNYNKLKRHSDKFEQSFGTFLGSTGGRFRAYKGTSNLQDESYVTAPASNPDFIPIAGLTVDADYVDETSPGAFDDGGNWNNATSVYTLPSSGDYSFTDHIELEIDGFTGQEQFFMTSTIFLLDSALNFKASDSFFQSWGGGNPAIANGFHSFDHTWVLNGLATDIVFVRYTFSYLPNQAGNQNNPRTITVLYTSYFECNGSPESGIAITNGNLQIKKYLHEFEMYLSGTEFENIIQNPTSMCAFVMHDVTRYGWIEEMLYEHQYGSAKVKLLTSSTENASA